MGNFSYSHQISVSDENAPFKYDLQRQHVVFSGTEILQGKAQTGDYCKSVVIRTGNFRQIVNNFPYIHLKLSSRGYQAKQQYLYMFFFFSYFHCMNAIMYRSGFMTTKGELVRSILFPPPLDFQFHRDFLKSIYVFLSLGMIGMSYSLYMWIRNGVSTL